MTLCVVGRGIDTYQLGILFAIEQHVNMPQQEYVHLRLHLCSPNDQTHLRATASAVARQVQCLVRRDWPHCNQHIPSGRKSSTAKSQLYRRLHGQPPRQPHFCTVPPRHRLWVTPATYREAATLQTRAFRTTLGDTSHPLLCRLTPCSPAGNRASGARQVQQRVRHDRPHRNQHNSSGLS